MKHIITAVIVIAGLVMLGACNKSRIGDSHQGGIVFYVDKSGKHGLIAAPADHTTRLPWSNGNDTVRTTATGKDVGTGQSNTRAIVDKLGPGNYAAYICDQLVIDGYDDWYLPSTEELNLLYQQKGKVGGFADYTYWSSTDLLGSPYAYFAMNQYFVDGSRKLNVNMNKGEPNNVRAIRSF